jgi:hypothetical protein
MYILYFYQHQSKQNTVNKNNENVVRYCLVSGCDSGDNHRARSDLEGTITSTTT